MAKKVYDYSKLLGKMREKHITQEQMANLVGIAESTMSIKLKSKSQFSQDEMVMILNILNVPLEHIALYFFCPDTFENAS